MGDSFTAAVSLTFLGFVLTFLWSTFKHLFLRTPLDNVPGPAPESLATGNLQQMFGRGGWKYMQNMCEKYGSVVKVHGFFGEKHLFVFDPVALQSVVLKDQDVYEESPTFLITNRFVLGDGSLLSTLGEEHRKQRKLLSGIFSTENLRAMTPKFHEVVGRLRDTLIDRVKSGRDEIDMHRWLHRTALELVGQTCLGTSFDPLISDDAAEYSAALRAYAPTVWPMRKLLLFLSGILPFTWSRQLLAYIPLRRVQQIRKIVDTFRRSSREIYTQEVAQGYTDVAKEGAENRVLLDRLMQAQDDIPAEEIIAQISTFTFAATDTTSGTIAHILHFLSEHPDAQNKVREEIIAAIGERDSIPYEELVDLPYLDAVCRESLRLFPPTAFLHRVVAKDIVMPLSTPIKAVDGSTLPQIFMPKGARIFIGILAANTNPDVWGPDAGEWKPERWLAPLPESVYETKSPGVYSHMMTFLGGGRGCIGFQFTLLEIKVVLSVLLEAFMLSPPSVPITWNVSGIQYPSTTPGDPEASMPLKLGLNVPVV